MDEVCQHTSQEDVILLCVDDSEHSMRALQWYHQHFHRKSHMIELVHIYNAPEVTSLPKHHKHDHPLEALAHQEYQKSFDAVQKKSALVTGKYTDACAQRGIKCRVVAKEKCESVGQTICNVATEHQATCIIMGQRGLGAIKRTIFGSVSDFVLHHAKASVLVVPPNV